MSLSIVTCIKNGEPFVEEYSKNIKELKETLGINLELIIVDDGSTDNGIEILRRNLPWSRIIENQGTPGLPSARNIGKQEINHDKALLLDVDDRVHGQGLMHLLTILDEKQADMVFGNVSFVDEQGKTALGHKFRDVIANRFNENKAEQLLHKNTIVTLGAAVFRSNVLRRFSFDEELTIGEDWEYLVRLHVSQIKIAYEAQIVLDYTVHESSMSSSHSPHKVKKLHDKLLYAYSQVYSGSELQALTKKMELSIFTSSISRSVKSKSMTSLLKMFWRQRHLISPSYVIYFVYFFSRKALGR